MDKPSADHILHYLPEQTTSLLDVGCNVGESLVHANKLGVKKLRGIEINPHAIEPAKENTKMISDCEITHGSADHLPYPDKSMDIVICSEVLEHVPQELRASVVDQIHRVLKDDQPLIITFPFRGLFGYLDPANFRMIFPTFFGFLSKLLGGGGRDTGFEGQKHGVVWHHHFSLEEIHELFGNKFSLEIIRYRGGFLFPLGEWLLFPIYRMKLTHTFFYRMIKKIQAIDNSLQYGKYLAYDVLLVLKKKP